MTKNISSDAEIDSVRLTQQTSHPSSPSSGYESLYVISGSSHGGLFLKDSSGKQIGPFITGTNPNAGSSILVQTVFYITGAVNTGATTIPIDNTIPQSTEGDQYMAITITPTSASNYIYVSVVAWLSHSVLTSWLIGALFKDSESDARAVQAELQETAFGNRVVTFTYRMLAGTTSAITFKFRAGGNNAGTMTFNGTNGNPFFGGVIASSMTAEEIIP